MQPGSPECRWPKRELSLVENNDIDRKFDSFLLAHRDGDCLFGDLPSANQVADRVRRHCHIDAVWHEPIDEHRNLAASGRYVNPAAGRPLGHDFELALVDADRHGDRRMVRNSLDLAVLHRCASMEPGVKILEVA